MLLKKMGPFEWPRFLEEEQLAGTIGRMRLATWSAHFSRPQLPSFFLNCDRVNVFALTVEKSVPSAANDQVIHRSPLAALFGTTFPLCQSLLGTPPDKGDLSAIAQVDFERIFIQGCSRGLFYPWQSKYSYLSILWFLVWKEDNVVRCPILTMESGGGWS